MVLSVCRRVAHNLHDAEDAFQATFVVLVCKAASLRSRQSACRLVIWGGIPDRDEGGALMRQKRRAKERKAAEQPRRASSDDTVSEELLARLDQELNRLPDRYRLPVLLCELQGQSRKHAARALGLPEGTLSSRLAHARKLLAQRLAPYGTMLSAGAVAAVLARSAASSPVPAALVRNTLGVGMQVVAGEALAAGSVPVQVHAITEGVLKAMLLSKLKLVCGMTLVLASGRLWWVGHTVRPRPPIHSIRVSPCPPGPPTTRSRNCGLR